jgi:hypothetical protein
LTVSRSRAVPLGLLGEARNTTVGCSRLITAIASAWSMEKSSSRRPTTQRVAVSRAYSGYIEYVGANDTAVRPGPPNACRTWSITSFDPFAAQTRSIVSPWPR